VSLVFFNFHWTFILFRCYFRCFGRAALRLTLSLISVKQKGVQHLIKYSRRDRAANKRPDNIDSTAAKVVNGRKPRPHLNKSHFKRAPTALPFPFTFPFRWPQTKDSSDERERQMLQPPWRMINAVFAQFVSPVEIIERTRAFGKRQQKPQNVSK